MNNSYPAKICVCTLYHFVGLPNYAALQQPLLELLDKHYIQGTLLLAQEGINGTVAGKQQDIDALLVYLRQIPELTTLTWKISFHKQFPFHCAKVKLKQEIVTMGVANISPNQGVGSYVKPQDWNHLISDPEVTVIDTRNEYEINIGSFKNAINPHTCSFREFPTYVKAQLDPAKHKKVAMFCTGGIRCEKASAYLNTLGFKDVYHLQGGILKYFQEVPLEESLWQGECFVFDDRVTVNHQLERGQYEQCHACRMPITKADKQSDAYVRGVSCPHCITTQSVQQKARFIEREKQVKLAKARGESHIGMEARTVQKSNKARKQIRKNQLKA